MSEQQFTKNEKSDSNPNLEISDLSLHALAASFIVDFFNGKTGTSITSTAFKELKNYQEVIKFIYKEQWQGL